MDRETAHQVTRLLRAAGGSELGTPETQAALVYEELRARMQLERERKGHSSQPTALVHAAWLRLEQQERVQRSDREHVFAVAATCIRRVLVDYARRAEALKRGDGTRRAPLEELENSESADVLSVSAGSIERDLRLACALLAHELSSAERP